MNRNGVILLALRVISQVEWSQRCLTPVQEESSLHYQMIPLDPRSLHRIGRGWTHNTKETQHKQFTARASLWVRCAAIGRAARFVVGRTAIMPGDIPSPATRNRNR